MKLSCVIVAAVASASLLLAPQVSADGDYDVCYDLKPGQPCKNAQGQDSRCSHRSVCIENLKECPSGSTLLQSCSSTQNVYCYPLFEGKPLLCLDDVDIETTVQRDACTGKSDGTACRNAYCEGNGKAGLTATVYEQDGACEDSYCMATIFTKCDNVAAGAICTNTAVLGGKSRSFTGTCKTEEPYRPWCKSDSDGVVLGDAKVLVAPASTTSSSASTVSTAPTSTPSKTPTTSASSNNSTKSSAEDPQASTSTSTPVPTTTAPSSGSAATIASSMAAVSFVVVALILT